MSALADNLRAAPGANRDLDGEIWCLVHGHTFVKSDWAGQFGRAVYYGDGNQVAFHDPDVPSYTASVDAALSLIDASSHYAIGRVDGEFCTQIEADGIHIGDDMRSENVAATQALSICLAFVQAAT